MLSFMDEGYRDYATNREWECYEAYCKHQNYEKAAKAIGAHYRTLQDAVRRMKRRAARNGYAPREEKLQRAPEGYSVRGTSILYDSDGNISAKWVKTKIEDEQLYAAMQEAVKVLCEDIKPVKPVRKPKRTNESLMSVYPVGDHHIGMYAWHEEAEEDYDTQEAERLLNSAFNYLTESAPKSKTGLIILLGDFLHYDSYESVTPKHKHILDADTRFPRIVRAAIRAVRYAIQKALESHEDVRVIVVSGNHDPASMVFLREALTALYEKEKRVSVDRSPKMFHYFRFGKVLIGTHHGDRVKMDKLPLLMASDVPEDWGASIHRVVYTGHVHHESVKDHNGCKVESVRILAPADAYAYGLGYRTPRDMRRIDFHEEYGEVARQIVTPGMLK